MEGEMRGFIMAWSVVVASLTYCYFISSKIRQGNRRLISILPIISIFTLLPLLHSSFYLQFYFGPCIAWLANFKLLLFAFGKYNALSINPSISLLHFILVIAVPIRIKQNSSQNNKNVEKPSCMYSLSKTFVVNALIWSLMIQVYVNYKHHVLLENPIVVHFLYSARMIFGIQVQFALFAALTKPFLGQELEPQFNKPHLSTSLQNFWGRRWNLMVTSLLKSTIHEPTKSFLTPMLGKRWAVHPAILVTYVVSGLIHEVMHFYVGRRWPTWEVLWFFIIHGVFLVLEIEVKKLASRRGWTLHPVISIPLTVGFVIVTGIWLCYAELIHWGADVREVEEYTAFVEYVKHTLSLMIFTT